MKFIKLNGVTGGELIIDAEIIKWISSNNIHDESGIYGTAIVVSSESTSCLIVKESPDEILELIEKNTHSNNKLLPNLNPNKLFDEELKEKYAVYFMGIDDLEINIRAANSLNAARVNIIGELIQCSQEEIKLLLNVGRYTLRNIKDALRHSKIGLSLGMIIPDEIRHLIKEKHITYSTAFYKKNALSIRYLFDEKNI